MTMQGRQLKVANLLTPNKACKNGEDEGLASLQLDCLVNSS